MLKLPGMTAKPSQYKRQLESNGASIVNHSIASLASAGKKGISANLGEVGVLV